MNTDVGTIHTAAAPPDVGGGGVDAPLPSSSPLAPRAPSAAAPVVAAGRSPSSGNIDPATAQTLAYLRSLPAVRERSRAVFDLIVAGEADHWDWHADKLPLVVEFCASLVTRDYGTDYASIPPHCRRNHFTTTNSDGTFDRVATLMADPRFPTDRVQAARTLVDLYVVSVLLDAGAGNDWVYREYVDGAEVWVGGRSEGLAVASFHMFVNGVFSSDPNDPLRVDSTALKQLRAGTLGKHMQVTDANPMSGLEGRAGLLAQLGDALDARRDIVKDGRPGDILYYLLPTLAVQDGVPVLPLEQFWETLFALLAPIWPARTTLPAAPEAVLGDVWPCPSLLRARQREIEINLANNAGAAGDPANDGSALVPFHKLSQWLAYSLLEPIENVARWRVDRGAGQTGLPEYRNGGLLVDLGVLTPRDLPDTVYPNGRDAPPLLPPGHPAVVEWRAATVIALDLIHSGVCDVLGVTPAQLGLAQVLEASTWKGGRQVARERRANGGPPVEIVSDGTLF